MAELVRVGTAARADRQRPKTRRDKTYQRESDLSGVARSQVVDTRRHADGSRGKKNGSDVREQALEPGF